MLSWLDEAAAEKEQAELALKAATQLAPPSLSTEEIVAAVEHSGGLTGILHGANDEERAALYESIGVSAVYNPDRNQVRIGADPVAPNACRRGESPHARMDDSRSLATRVTGRHHSPAMSRAPESAVGSHLIDL